MLKKKQQSHEKKIKIKINKTKGERMKLVRMSHRNQQMLLTHDEK
jgi:hypothetical protein